jgi:hypothetical protein
MAYFFHHRAGHASRADAGGPARFEPPPDLEHFPTDSPFLSFSFVRIGRRPPARHRGSGDVKPRRVPLIHSRTSGHSLLPLSLLPSAPAETREKTQTETSQRCAGPANCAHNRHALPPPPAGTKPCSSRAALFSVLQAAGWPRGRVYCSASCMGYDGMASTMRR